MTYLQRGTMDPTTNHQPLKIPIEGNSTTWWPSDPISQQEGFFNKVIIISTTQEVPQCLHHSFKGARTIKPPFVGVLSLSHALGSSPRVPIAHQPTHDHIISFKGLRTIKPSSLGPRTSSWLLHKARGFMSFFNHLSHARGPLWVKIHHEITCGVSSPSLRVPWHHQSMNYHRMGH